ncbi:[FeFe] hydrogenase H-cluster radical SAM maturase HydG [Oleidesulfovibrio sp.]|uniref:[FeFe] hydrogenase H-cluster radical SAM maturase HydG n=1 Tax=Oleidesulfovibrio sp. TaxID=2909707 RepID=UPI003A866841
MTFDSRSLPSFIDEEKIESVIAATAKPDAVRVREILAKAREAKGLDADETATLLQLKNDELDHELFTTAKAVKQKIYGSRMVLFAPLYITNECYNRCAYCGFNAENGDLQRRTLSEDEIRAEVEVLERLGHKRLLLVYGEHPRLDADWMAKTIQVVYDTVSEKSGEIRRVNINCAPQSVEGFKKLHDVSIGTYQCFQETYHQATYQKAHLGGPKKDYLWRLYAMHRAMEAGIDDVGMGPLLGLYDHKFEILAMMQHAADLEKHFGVGPHTISFPRLEPALNAEMAFNPPYPITDHEFKRMVAVLRLAVPYTGLILSTRENAQMRRELLELGVSQISAGSRTYPGAYSDPSYDRPDVQQFCVGDNRSLDEVIAELVSLGYLPSWCTACYRLGRTGEHFMELAKKGFIQEFCHPNALLTFNEYLHDYASDVTRESGKVLVEHELQECAEGRRGMVAERLKRIDAGERDLYI